MRWFRIREAEISYTDREEFEQFGVATIQFMLASGNLKELDSSQIDVGGALPSAKGVPPWAKSRVDAFQYNLLSRKKPAALSWLVEQYDRQERKETWSITMEAAITAFVLAELILALIKKAG